MEEIKIEVIDFQETVSIYPSKPQEEITITREMLEALLVAFTDKTNVFDAKQDMVLGDNPNEKGWTFKYTRNGTHHEVRIYPVGTQTSFYIQGLVGQDVNQTERYRYAFDYVGINPVSDKLRNLGDDGFRFKTLFASIVDAEDGFIANGQAGVDGTFTSNRGKTVTVTKGLITNIV